MTLSSWYFRSESIYFDIFYADSKLRRFKIVIKPDLSDASLHFINMSEINLDDYMLNLESQNVHEGYHICEDALVYFWNHRKTWGAYAVLTSAPFTNVVTRWNSDGRVGSLCPTSGRFVCWAYDDDGSFNYKIVVVDLF